MSPTRFAGQLCVLCRTRPSSRRGEHVWPLWLLALWESDGKGPYTPHVGKRPLTDRLGVPLERENLTRVKLPVCNPGCNAVLNDRYERHQGLVERVFTLGSFGPEEAELAGRWFLKTWLLLAHPEVWHELDGQDQDELRPRPWAGAPDSLFDWLVQIPEPTPPSDFSVWLHREDASTQVPKGERRRVPLPEYRIGVDPPVTLRWKTATVFGLSVTLVHHPGWAVDHPLESEDRAVRLWPSLGKPIDLAALPLVPRDDTTFESLWSVTFSAGVSPLRDMPPLSHTSTFDLELGLIEGVSLNITG